MLRTFTPKIRQGNFIIYMVVVIAWFGLALAVCAQSAGENDFLRGGKVGWARLHTPDRAWHRHSEMDFHLSAFIRDETSLNMDPTWYSASVDDLNELCAYPFIFANSLASVSSIKARANLVEYFKRGGFIVVDACINRGVNPDPALFFENNQKVFHALLPSCEIRLLPPEHEIYSCFFNMEEKPPHTYHDAQYDRRWARHGLYGVFDGNRMVAVISLSGLQCGWAGVASETPNHPRECMKMMLNIYVYAMTH